MAASTVMTQDAWEAALSSGKYSKTWLTNTMVRMQQHESKMAMLAVLREDPQMKFYLGVGLGSFAAVAAAIATGNLSDVLPKASGHKSSTGASEYKSWPPGFTMTSDEFSDMLQEAREAGYTEQQAAQGWYWSSKRGLWIYVPPGYYLNLKTGMVISEDQKDIEVQEFLQKADPLGFRAITDSLTSFSDITKMMGGIVGLAGVSFAGFCAACLILQSIFGGTDFGEMLSGMGSVVP